MNVDSSNGENKEVDPRIAITINIRRKSWEPDWSLTIWSCRVKMARFGWELHGNLVSWNQSSLLSADSLTNDGDVHHTCPFDNRSTRSFFFPKRYSPFPINLSPSCQTRLPAFIENNLNIANKYNLSISKAHLCNNKSFLKLYCVTSSWCCQFIIVRSDIHRFQLPIVDSHSLNRAKFTFKFSWMTEIHLQVIYFFTALNLAVSFISSRQRCICTGGTVVDSFVFMCHIPTSNDEAFCSYLTSLPPSVGMPNDRCPIFSKSVVLLWVLWGTTQLHNRETEIERKEK